MKNNIPEILKRFDEKFPRLYFGQQGQYNADGSLRTFVNEEIKQFIESEITKALEEQRKEIRKETIKECKEKIIDKAPHGRKGDWKKLISFLK